MAQVGDTITYTFSDGSSVAEDISNIDEIEIDYVDGPGGGTAVGTGGAGGRVENVVADVSESSTLYIWVGGAGGSTNTRSGGAKGIGRYDGGDGTSGAYDGSAGGGGTSEVSLQNTEASDSATEPFIAAAGGGGGGDGDAITGGAGGARGRAISEGNSPPLGGVGGGGNAEGSVDGHSGTQATITGSGTTVSGGGSAAEKNGEIQVTYKQSVPDAPSNLNAEVQ